MAMGVQNNVSRNELKKNTRLLSDYSHFEGSD